MVMMRDAATSRHIVGEFDQESSANISSARCQIVRDFLAHPAKPEWLWMIDSDMTFGHDILDRLLATADPTERPIVGGLCFGVRPVKFNGVEQFNDCLATPLELFPTIYTLNESGQMQHWNSYPRDTVVQVHSTGAACLLVHRSVFADERWTQDGHPLPWFRESVLNGKVCSEDHFFCIKAGSLGYPLHLDTAAKTGHVKTFIADEDLFLAQRAAHEPEPVTAVDVTGETIDIVIPTYGRADRLARVAVNAIEATPNIGRLLFVVEDDDDATIDALNALPDLRIQVIRNEGPRTYAGAVNTAAKYVTGNWLFTGADDLSFKPGWDEAALTLAMRTGAKVVGTNDMWNQAVLAGHHSTHSLVAMDYITGKGATADAVPGKVLHDYHHNFVDPELVQVAMSRGVYAHCHTAVVEHLHPLAGKAPTDDTYDRGSENWDADEALFVARRPMWAA